MVKVESLCYNTTGAVDSELMSREQMSHLNSFEFSGDKYFKEWMLVTQGM